MREDRSENAERMTLAEMRALAEESQRDAMLQGLGWASVIIRRLAAALLDAVARAELGREAWVRLRHAAIQRADNARDEEAETALARIDGKEKT